MSSTLKPIIEARYADGVIAKGSVVKGGSNDEHVAISSAATQKHIGIAQNASAAAEDILEVSVGGGAKGLAGGTIADGDLLTSDSSGRLVATTTANDKIIAQAKEAAVVGDLFSCAIHISNF